MKNVEKKKILTKCKISRRYLTNGGTRDILNKSLKRVCVQYAGVAQLVEQLICNQQVGGSSPSTSSNAGGDAPRQVPPPQLNANVNLLCQAPSRGRVNDKKDVRESF